MKSIREETPRVNSDSNDLEELLDAYRDALQDMEQIGEHITAAKFAEFKGRVAAARQAVLSFVSQLISEARNPVAAKDSTFGVISEHGRFLTNALIAGVDRLDVADVEENDRRGLFREEIAIPLSHLRDYLTTLESLPASEPIRGQTSFNLLVDELADAVRSVAFASRRMTDTAVLSKSEGRLRTARSALENYVAELDATQLTASEAREILEALKEPIFFAPFHPIIQKLQRIAGSALPEKE